MILYLFILEMLDWKIRFDESENPAVRLLRGVTDRVAHMLSMFCFW